MKPDDTSAFLKHPCLIEFRTTVLQLHIELSEHELPHNFQVSYLETKFGSGGAPAAALDAAPSARRGGELGAGRGSDGPACPLRGRATLAGRANARLVLPVGHFERGAVGQWRAALAFTAHIMRQSRAGKGK